MTALYLSYTPHEVDLPYVTNVSSVGGVGGCAQIILWLLISASVIRWLVIVAPIIQWLHIIAPVSQWLLVTFTA